MLDDDDDDGVADDADGCGDVEVGDRKNPDQLFVSACPLQAETKCLVRSMVTDQPLFFGAVGMMHLLRLMALMGMLEMVVMALLMMMVLVMVLMMMVMIMLMLLLMMMQLA